MDSKGAPCWQPPSLGCLTDVKPFWRGFGVAGCAWAAGGMPSPWLSALYLVFGDAGLVFFMLMESVGCPASLTWG